MADKTADLAGPGISTYEEVEKILPKDYRSLLDPKETQIAITAAKRFIEDGLCQELNLIRVEVPLIVSRSRYTPSFGKTSRNRLSAVIF